MATIETFKVLKKRKRIALLFAAILLCTATVGQTSPYGNLNSVIQPQNLKGDIDYWLDWVHSTHPDLSYTVKDIDKFYRTVAQIRDSIDSPLTVLEFWKRISPLNYQLSDGHIAVGHINAPIVTDYVKNGGTFFPFEVVFDKDGLFIHSNIGGNYSEYKGYAITDINDMPIASILAPMLLRTNSDTDVQRRALIQRKFALFYMLLYGESKEFEVTLKNGAQSKTILVKGLSELPTFYKQHAFADNFNFEIVCRDNAVLTINEFGWDDKKQYYDFMDSCFMMLRQNKIRHLIIDVRENGGGDDEFWMQGILKYIANKPYRWGSNYTKKIIVKYRDAGEVIGSIKSGKIDTLIAIDRNNKHRFNGKVSVLIGPYTYSSAILFANTVQDYKFAELVGEPTGGKSGQTGAIQFSKMPNSGLTIISPRFYLERPKGGNLKEPVQPDIKYPMTRKILAN